MPSPKRKSAKTIRDLEIELDIARRRIDQLQGWLESISTSHLRVGNAVADYIRKNEKNRDTIGKQLADELSLLHGKIVALKK